MGNIGFVGLKYLGLALRDELNITTFVETGTYRGQTTAWAAEHFENVVSIEAYRQYYDRAVKSLTAPNIKLLFGDSRDMLGQAIADLDQPAMIWLDAHWCGNYEKSFNTSGECPLIDELRILKKSGVRHLILIDDAQLFVEPPPEPHDPKQWPTLEQIKKLLPDGYRAIIWNDAIIAVPPEAIPIVERFTRASEIEVIVLTSNAYLHCLPAFTYLFNKFWSAGQAAKVVRYEIRPAKMPGNFSNFAVGIQSEYTWSSGLIKYLAHHNDDLILLLLEDYFLDKPVDTVQIKQLWRYMKQRPEIAKIDLSDDRLKVAHTDYESQYFDDLVRSDDDAPFQTSLQAAIWRKDVLLKYLKPNETPWQFEKQGTRRVIKDRKSGKFDGLILGCKSPPLSYVNAKGGEGTQPEQWAFKRFPGWMIEELKGKL